VWTEEIARTMGVRTRLAVTGDLAARDRDYYTTPALTRPPQLDESPIQLPMVFSDSCIWPGDPRIVGNPPTLRAIYPELVRRKHADIPIKDADHVTLNKFLIWDPVRKIHKYAGPSHLARWLGLDRQQILDITSRFPCERPSDCSIGLFCRNCFEICQALGRAWNVPVATEIIYCLLHTAVQPYLVQGPLTPTGHIRLFTSGSPCTKISRGALMEHTHSMLLGPHAYPSNLMWKWHAGIVRYAKRMYEQRAVRNFFLPHTIHVCSPNCEHAITADLVRKYMR